MTGHSCWFPPPLFECLGGTCSCIIVDLRIYTRDSRSATTELTTGVLSCNQVTFTFRRGYATLACEVI